MCCFSRADILDHATGSLCATFVEYIDGARMFLESEADKDSVALQEIRLHFSDFIQHLIRTVPGELLRYGCTLVTSSKHLIRMVPGEW